VPVPGLANFHQCYRTWPASHWLLDATHCGVTFHEGSMLMYQSSYGSFPTNVSRFVRNSLNFLLLFLNEFVFIGSVPKQFLLDQTVTWAGPAKFRHLIKAFLFQKSALLGTKSTKREPAITETATGKFKT
jgi:hypothetical protein